MGLFDERIAYKPFEYPEYYTEGWLPQAQAFWLHTEIPMTADVKDWNEKLTPAEKHLVGNILLGFAQTEGDDVRFTRNYSRSSLLLFK